MGWEVWMGWTYRRSRRRLRFLEEKGGQVSFCFSLRFGVCLSVCLLRSPDSVVVGCRPGTGANSLCESDNHMVGILVVKSLESGHRGRLSGD